jgi:hypothetical protein
LLRLPPLTNAGGQDREPEPDGALRGEDPRFDSIRDSKTFYDAWVCSNKLANQAEALVLFLVVGHLSGIAANRKAIRKSSSGWAGLRHDHSDLTQGIVNEEIEGHSKTRKGAE